MSQSVILSPGTPGFNRETWVRGARRLCPIASLRTCRQKITCKACRDSRGLLSLAPRPQSCTRRSWFCHTTVSQSSGRRLSRCSTRLDLVRRRALEQLYRRLLLEQARVLPVAVQQGAPVWEPGSGLEQARVRTLPPEFLRELAQKLPRELPRLRQTRFRLPDGRGTHLACFEPWCRFRLCRVRLRQPVRVPVQ